MTELSWFLTILTRQILDLRTSGKGVGRTKAVFSSGWKSHPAMVAPAGSNRSSYGGNEIAEASDETDHF